MRKQPALKERVAILEERLKLYESPTELELALADSTAKLRCAREKAEREQRLLGVVAVAMVMAFFAPLVVRALN
jgi:hypothetical protein